MATVPYYPIAPPIKGEAYTFYISLVSTTDTDIFQSNATLAAGDVKISIDGSTFANIATLPSAVDSSKLISVSCSTAETNGNKICILFSDAAGDEWQDALVELVTVASYSPWSSSDEATRNLTAAGSTSSAAVSGTTLNITHGATYTGTISGLTIPATWSVMYFTCKQHTSDADSLSMIQIQVSSTTAATDGITYLDRTAATDTTRAYGSLVVTQASGTVDITIADEGTLLLPVGGYTYDVKTILSGGTSQVLSASAQVNVSYTETFAIT